MNLRSKIHLLFPFDLGLELDFTGRDASDFFKEISARKMGAISFEGKSFFNAEFSGSL